MMPSGGIHGHQQLARVEGHARADLA